MPDGFAGFARKALGFAARPLVDVPTLPGGRVGRAVEQAVEGSTSPIGLLSVALLPVTGGTSLGFAGTGGLAARLATRAGAELATSAAGGLAAEEVAKRVQDSPGVIKYGAPILAGLAGSGGVAAGLNRAALRLEPGQQFGFASRPPSTAVPPEMDFAALKKSLPKMTLKTVGPEPPMYVQGGKIYESLPDNVRRQVYEGPEVGVLNQYRPDPGRIKRGADALISRVAMEARLGRLPAETVRPSVQFARSLPDEYLRNLGSSYTSLPSARLAGRYSPDTSIMTIFSDTLANSPSAAEGTIIHEVAHHLQQFVTDKEYQAIQNTWKETTKPRYDQYLDGLREIASDYGLETRKFDDPVEIKSRLANIRGATTSSAPNTSWTTASTSTSDLANEAMGRVGDLERQFTYAERGGVNEWFAEQLRGAELSRQSGAVPSSLSKFMDKTRSIISGYEKQAAPNVLRRMQK